MNHPTVETCSCPSCTLFLAIECATRAQQIELADDLAVVLGARFPEAAASAAKLRASFVEILANRARPGDPIPPVNAIGCGVPS